MKEAEAKAIDEVVITGTGVQRKRDSDGCHQHGQRRPAEKQSVIKYCQLLGG